MTTRAQSNQANRRDVLHQMLAALRDETYERVHELRHQQEGDADLAPGDEMDRARASVEVETHASLIAGAEERLRYIDEALARVDSGRYGICVGCREPIPVERLVALPFAVYCVNCQQSRSGAGHGWNDGTVIQPYDRQWTLPMEMEEQAEDTAASEAVLAVSNGNLFAETTEGPAMPRAKRRTPPRRK